MTITTSATLAGSPAKAGYREAVWSEWTKFRTVRSSVVTAGLLGLVFPVFAVVVAATDSLQPDDTILGASVLGGAALAQLLAASLGAVLITGEFRSGTIRSTLAACPRLLTVLGAKATVAAATVFAVTLPAGVVAFGIGVAMLDEDTYARGDGFPALLGVALAMASLAVLGVGIGTIVRHSAGAVTTVVAIVLLPGLVAPLLGDTERWLGGASLNGVLQKLSQSSDATHETVGSLGAWPSLLVVAAYAVAAVLGSAWALRHRDT